MKYLYYLCLVLNFFIYNISDYNNPIYIDYPRYFFLKEKMYFIDQNNYKYIPLAYGSVRNKEEVMLAIHQFNDTYIGDISNDMPKEYTLLNKFQLYPNNSYFIYKIDLEFMSNWQNTYFYLNNLQNILKMFYLDQEEFICIQNIHKIYVTGQNCNYKISLSSILNTSIKYIEPITINLKNINLCKEYINSLSDNKYFLNNKFENELANFDCTLYVDLQKEIFENLEKIQNSAKEYIKFFKIQHNCRELCLERKFFLNYIKHINKLVEHGEIIETLLVEILK